MHLRNLRISNQNGAIGVLDGRILEVFQDRRARQAAPRMGDEARRRKPPQALEPYLLTGRIWVARGWVAVDAAEASRFPKGREMLLQHPEFDNLHVTSLRVNHGLAQRLNLEHALVFDLHALFLPTPMQLERLRSMHVMLETSGTR